VRTILGEEEPEADADERRAPDEIEIDPPALQEIEADPPVDDEGDDARGDEHGEAVHDHGERRHP
jgi:hypothetical protein